MILWWEMSPVAFSWEKHRRFSNTCFIKYQWLFLLMGFFSFWRICDTASVWFLIPVPLQVASDIAVLVLCSIIPLVNRDDHEKIIVFSAEHFEHLSRPILQLHQQSLEWSVDLTKAPPSSTPSLPSSSETIVEVQALADFIFTLYVPGDRDARTCLWMGSIHHSF